MTTRAKLALLARYVRALFAPFASTYRWAVPTNRRTFVVFAGLAALTFAVLRCAMPVEAFTMGSFVMAGLGILVGWIDYWERW